MKLITVKETASLLRVTPQSVYRMVRAGVVPSLHMGRQVRIDAAALERWLIERSSATGDAQQEGLLPRSTPACLRGETPGQQGGT